MKKGEIVIKKVIISILITFLVCLVIGFGYWNYLKDNSNRVVHGIDFNNETFHSVNFKYTDLSNEIRKVVSKEEFQEWDTWEDVKNSLSDVSEIKDNGDMNIIYHGNPIGVVLSYYDFTLTGYKLRYIKFESP
jgi:hypothetical protein